MFIYRYRRAGCALLLAAALLVGCDVSTPAAPTPPNNAAPTLPPVEGSPSSYPAPATVAPVEGSPSSYPAPATSAPAPAPSAYPAPSSQP